MSRREIFCELENRVPPAMQPKQRRPSGPGTQVDSSATLKERFSDEILSQKILPENGVVAAREMTLCLTEIQAADGAHKIWRVWLHTDMLRGTCASRGRLIGFKSDSAELANGFMIFNKVGIP